MTGMFRAVRRVLEAARIPGDDLPWGRMERDLEARAELLEFLRGLELWTPQIQ